MNIFSERLSQLMHEQQLTQEDIAKAVGKTRQGVGRWLNNDAVPDIITVGKLANYLDVSTDYLAGISDIKKHTPVKANIQDETGLSEKSIDLLSSLVDAKNNSKLKNDERYLCQIDVVNALIECLDYHSDLTDSIRTAVNTDANEDLTKSAAIFIGIKDAADLRKIRLDRVYASGREYLHHVVDMLSPSDYLFKDNEEINNFHLRENEYFTLLHEKGEVL